MIKPNNGWIKWNIFLNHYMYEKNNICVIKMNLK